MNTAHGARADRRAGRARSSARSTGPAAPPRGIAVVCHPHPLFGGTMDNKVVQTMARACVAAAAGAACASTSAASAPPKAPGTKAAARSTTRSPSIAGAARDSPACRCVLGRLLVRRLRRRRSAAQRLADGDKPRRLVLVGPSTEKQHGARRAAPTRS